MSKPLTKHNTGARPAREYSHLNRLRTSLTRLRRSDIASCPAIEGNCGFCRATLLEEDSMPINRQLLAENAGGDADLADQLLTIYIDRARNIADALRACDPASAGQLGDLAHGIRGSALAIGATNLADLALQCELVFRHEDDSARTRAREALIAGIDTSVKDAAAALPMGT
jgi:HPt (histidine-containing phosphotransfer) domain-containing protein